MSKDILSLKFRPQNFDEFIGQPQVVYPLINSIKNGNIHHAYLFFGPRGVGKTSAARILAKMLNCENGPTPSPCNKCKTCIEITNNISPDVIEIDGASNRGINEIRQLQENIKFAPLKSRYKIYIIDEVHMLTKEAFNALLKTLEEPPEHVIFIFATTEIYKVLPTIRSRCQQYQFKLFSIDEIKQLLIKILKYYNIKFESKALYWIAKFANGSLRDSLSILSQIIAFDNKNITEKNTLYILGVQPIDNLINLFNAVVNKDINLLYKIINDTQLNGIDPGNFAQQIVDFLRIFSFINNNLTEYEILEMSKDDFEKVKEIASRFSTKQIIFMIEKLADFIKYMGIYLNPYPYLENIIISFAYYEDFIYPSEIISEIKDVKRFLEKKYIKVSNLNREENINKKLKITNKTDNNIKNNLNNNVNIKEKSNTNEFRNTIDNGNIDKNNNINENNIDKNNNKLNYQNNNLINTNKESINTRKQENNTNDNFLLNKETAPNKESTIVDSYNRKKDNKNKNIEISNELKSTLDFDESSLFDDLKEKKNITDKNYNEVKVKNNSNNNRNILNYSNNKNNINNGNNINKLNLDNTNENNENILNQLNTSDLNEIEIDNIKSFENNDNTNSINNNKNIKNKDNNKSIKHKLEDLKSIAKENIKNNNNIPESYKPLMGIFDSEYIEE